MGSAGGSDTSLAAPVRVVPAPSSGSTFTVLAGPPTGWCQLPVWPPTVPAPAPAADAGAPAVAAGAGAWGLGPSVGLARLRRPTADLVSSTASSSSFGMPICFWAARILRMCTQPRREGGRGEEGTRPRGKGRRRRTRHAVGARLRHRGGASVRRSQRWLGTCQRGRWQSTTEPAAPASQRADWRGQAWRIARYVRADPRTDRAATCTAAQQSRRTGCDHRRPARQPSGRPAGTARPRRLAPAVACLRCAPRSAIANPPSTDSRHNL